MFLVCRAVTTDNAAVLASCWRKAHDHTLFVQLHGNIETLYMVAGARADVGLVCENGGAEFGLVAQEPVTFVTIQAVIL